MILQDLFEGRMKDIDIEYQDFLRSRGRNAMTDRQFQDAYGITRTEWAKKNREWTQQKDRRPVAPDAHLFHEQHIAEADPKLKQVWDRYARHLPAARGDTASVDQMEKSSKICQDIKNYVQTHYGEEAVDNMERYADRYLDETTDQERQTDRNARIIAGEIEDAAQQGNDQLIKQKIKELIKVGYTLDKNGNLQRMGMYESELEETFARPETAREQQVQLMARTYAELYWGDRSITARASTAREIFNAVMSGELDTATLKMEIRALEQEQDISEEQDACYRKVKSRYKVWPSAYASGALVQCRKKGAANWGNKSKK